tara:strand:+ start:76433 stop:76729 length:297 start_codon:yes stop_codon:yes gene_type:complete
MDSCIVKILNLPIYEDIINEEGKLVEQEEPSSYKVIYLPSMIHTDTIQEIHPKITPIGKLYKNVSTIKTTTDERFDIVGNYVKENERLFPKLNKIGYR